MPKRIILCSDGTGNKGGYGDDTNVYKLYTMVELQPKPNTLEQIVFYDNGVGTQSNKIIKALSEGLGFGFEENIRDLYEFLGRHYNPNDEVFLFGFSRGAATVRSFAGMIEVCGLVRLTLCETEEEFQHKIDAAMMAYRTFCSESKAIGSRIKTFKLREKAFIDNHIKIEFMGIWDTVSALGFPKEWSRVIGPFFEILGWLANHIPCPQLNNQHWFSYRPCFKYKHHHYQPDDVVRNVYHALAIDDNRHTFHPKIWGENERNEKKINQVWFAGAHSNVGGGYPRAGMSDVALHWMMVNANNHGLEFIDNAIHDVAARANPHDKLYDPRDRFGIFYRYAPRNLEKLCYTSGKENPTGKIKPGNIKIHKSVMDRLALHTAGYAPEFLPFAFQVVETPNITNPSPKPLPLQAGKNLQDWQDTVENVAKYVGYRQRLYSIFAETTFLLVMLMWTFWQNPPQFFGELPSKGHGFTDILYYVLPEFAEPFVYFSTIKVPWVFWVILGVALSLFVAKRMLIVKIKEYCSVARNKILRKIPKNKNNILDHVKLVKFIYLFPRLISLSCMVISIPIMFCNILYAFWPMTLPSSSFVDQKNITISSTKHFNETGLSVIKGREYVIRFKEDSKWKDDSQVASPIDGWQKEPVWYIRLMHQFWGRDPDKDLFTLAGIIDGPCPEGSKRCPININLIHSSDDKNMMKFTATTNGKLYLFANDLPFMYWNNCGAIKVSIEPYCPTPSCPS